MSRNLLLLALCLSTLACDVFYPVRHPGYDSGDAGYGSCDFLPSCNAGDQTLGYNGCPPGIACYLVSDCGATIACASPLAFDGGFLGCDVFPSCLPGDFAVGPYTSCPPDATCYGASACSSTILCEHFAADAGQGWDGGGGYLDAGQWVPYGDAGIWDGGAWVWDGGSNDAGQGEPDAGDGQCEELPSCFPGDLEVAAGSCSIHQLCYVSTLCGVSITCLHGGAADGG
jgi:hypothetical protein